MKQCVLVFILVFALLPYANANRVGEKWLSLYGDKIGFDVYRKGKKVGVYTTTFRQQDDEFFVDVSMQLKIKLFLGWHYRYQYDAQEIWRDGDLALLEANVNKNGKQTTFRVEKDLDQLVGQYRDEPVNVPLPILPTHHYDASVLNAKRVLNTLTGSENVVDIVKVSTQRLSLGGKTIQAKQYRYEGELHDTWVWYDDKDRWVKMTFLGSDGVPITLQMSDLCVLNQM